MKELTLHLVQHSLNFFRMVLFHRFIHHWNPVLHDFFKKSERKEFVLSLKTVFKVQGHKNRLSLHWSQTKFQCGFWNSERSQMNEHFIQAFFPPLSFDCISKHDEICSGLLTLFNALYAHSKQQSGQEKALFLSDAHSEGRSRKQWHFLNDCLITLLNSVLLRHFLLNWHS